MGFTHESVESDTNAETVLTQSDGLGSDSEAGEDLLDIPKLTYINVDCEECGFNFNPTARR